MIIGIVAIARNFAIGKDGKLPWHYSADLKFFKQTTTSNTVVMGFNTWRSIGKPLPNRLNIVLSRSEVVEAYPDTLVLRNREDVISLARYLKGDVFIIGGAKMFKNFADLIDKWVVTEIPLDVEDADTFMQHDFLNGFRTAETRDLGEGLTVKILQRV
jgi:dihydrofolate reductase